MEWGVKEEKEKEKELEPVTIPIKGPDKGLLLGKCNY